MEFTSGDTQWRVNSTTDAFSPARQTRKKGIEIYRGKQEITTESALTCLLFSPDTRHLTAARSIATIGKNGIGASDGAIVLINGENHYGMRFVLSNPRATKSSFLPGFVLALVFGGERACAESLSSAPYAA